MQLMQEVSVAIVIMEKRTVKSSKKFVSGVKLPPIGESKNDDVKTILDVDPHYYSLVEGRPIRLNTSINKYKQNIRDIALKRSLRGFLVDEILRINREIETERKIYKTASKHFEEYQNSFDKFLADDNNKTIFIMKKSDNLAKELLNQREEHRQASYELASIKSKVQYIHESLQILLSFQNFLYKAAPILWQRSQNLNIENFEIVSIDTDIFRKINKLSVINRLNKLPPPVLYFNKPEQLPNAFSLLEKQNLNYLLATEELNVEKIKFLKSLKSLKNVLYQELDFIQTQVKELESVIIWNEEREEELQKVFYRILNEKIRHIVSSEMALKIFNYVEFTYEKLIAPNDANLSSFDMTLSLEREFNNVMLDLSAFDENCIKTIERELYENEAKLTKQAYNASKLLKDVDKLSKRLQSSYEPSGRYK